MSSIIDPINPGTPTIGGPTNVIGTVSGLVNIDLTLSISGQIVMLFDQLSTSLAAIKLKLPTV